MKRILSVILSLALLASLLIIPMSVSATGEKAPQTVTFSYDNRGTYFEKDDTTRISDGLSPVIYTTYTYSGAQLRKNICNWKNYSETIPALSNGNVDARQDIGLPTNFDSSPNGYKPYSSTDATTVYDFDSSKINTYVDIIYDLGAVASINKIQQFSANYATTVGLYQIYTSTDVNTLFAESSLLLNYQNKTSDSAPYKGCQEHTFDEIEARYVVFRILSPTTTLANGNALRICELAIYGSYDEAPAYTVKPVPTFNAWTSTGGELMNIPEGNLLSLENLKIDGKQDGAYKELKEFQEGTGQYHNLLHDGKYGGHRDDRMHADVSIVSFYDGTNFRNGYDIQRDVDGNIVFTQNGDINTYTCFTYNLQTRHKITKFMLYGNNAADYTGINQMQAYEVYVGDNTETLYDSENKVAEYNNYFSMYGQVITFNDSFVGKYLGVKVLMPSLYKNDSNYIRLSEIAAYGKEVGAPVDSNLAPEIITSKSGYIYNKNGKSIYTNETDGSERTALRLTVGYKSPKVPGGADASKIVLKNGDTANVIERNVIAIAKSKYESRKLETLDIDTEGAAITTATNETNAKFPVSNYFKSEIIKDDDGNIIEKEKDYRMTYGALYLNNISDTYDDAEIVVTGRVVYEYEGEYYAVYSPIVGDEDTEVVSAESAYKILCENIAGANNGNYNSPLWFNNTKWNGEDFITQTSAQ